ncbi:hypothetical protein ACRAWD_20050 [Caulobacter segnis]
MNHLKPPPPACLALTVAPRGLAQVPAPRRASRRRHHPNRRKAAPTARRPAAPSHRRQQGYVIAASAELAGLAIYEARTASASPRSAGARGAGRRCSARTEAAPCWRRWTAKAAVCGCSPATGPAARFQPSTPSR